MRRFAVLLVLFWLLLLLSACNVLDPLVPSAFPTTTFFSHDEAAAAPFSGVPARWQSVYVTDSGKRYHARRDCSRMRNPTRLTREDAEARGYTPCAVCFDEE